MDVGRPFEFRRVGVACSDVARLQLLELLLCAEFVCLGGGSVLGSEGGGWGRGGGKGEGNLPLWEG